MAELRPYPFAALVRRAHARTRRAELDLRPARRQGLLRPAGSRSLHPIPPPRALVAPRPGRRTADPDGPEPGAVLARRMPGHGTQDRPDQGRPADPAAVHRHADRRLQRRVEPGTAPRSEPRRIRQGRDADRHPERERQAPDGARIRARDLRHERRLRPRGHPERPDPALHRRPPGREPRSSTDCAPRSPPSTPGIATSTSRPSCPTP